MVHGIWMQTLLNTESQWTVTEGVGPKKTLRKWEKPRPIQLHTKLWQITLTKLLWVVPTFFDFVEAGQKPKLLDNTQRVLSYIISLQTINIISDCRMIFCQVIIFSIYSYKLPRSASPKVLNSYMYACCWEGGGFYAYGREKGGVYACVFEKGGVYACVCEKEGCMHVVGRRAYVYAWGWEKSVCVCMGLGDWGCVCMGFEILFMIYRQTSKLGLSSSQHKNTFSRDIFMIPL